MPRVSTDGLLALLGIAAVAGALVFLVPSQAAVPLPAPKVDAPLAPAPGNRTAVFAGGCFWGVDAVFKHVRGVTRVVSGYAGGSAQTASYEQVSAGGTGHAESVQISYDPSRISYGQLLQVFFAVAHDPTELDRQGPDTGTQYRSAVFYANDDQRRVAEAYVAQLQSAHAFGKPIVTQIAPLKAFYEAEGYHQNYLALHPEQPYILINDLPKLASLKRQFPALYVGD